jgi:hypothetical protein
MTLQGWIDVVGSAACALTSLGFFTMHVVTSPRRLNWIVFPEYIRIGLMASGVMFLICAATLAPGDAAPQEQHMPPLGLLTTLVVAWTVCGLAVWIIRNYTALKHGGELEHVRPKSITDRRIVQRRP